MTTELINHKQPNIVLIPSLIICIGVDKLTLSLVI